MQGTKFESWYMCIYTEKAEEKGGILNFSSTGTKGMKNKKL